uniref:Triacylglycerol lipase n=1 Tax=Leptobrachium leishanense TaxID=445787 RepID=A0A8C5QJ46_9ANUR
MAHKSQESAGGSLSLDSFFQHVLLTEQAAKEQRQQRRQVKADIHSCQTKIREVTESLREVKTALEAKVCLLSEKRFERILSEKRHDIFVSQRDTLQKEKQELLAAHEQKKKDISDERECFFKEVMKFNDEYGLTSNRDALVREQTQAERQQLRAEEEMLRKEIQALKDERLHVNTLRLQRDSMKRELEELQHALKDLDEKTSDATADTRRLEDEKFTVSQKPQRDTECLRLKKELESYKEENEDLEKVHEALQAEIEYLQMMLLNWGLFLFLLGAVNAAQVCYNRIGCFADTSPWSGTIDRPIAKLPWSPETINTRFLLFTRSNQNSFQVISAINPSTISSSNFRTSRRTRFVIHGFTDSGEASWLSNICRRLFTIEDVNCIAVDWSGGSRTQYTQAANNIRVVGAEIAYFLDILQTNFGYAPSNVHLIGHSLGAHTAGEAGTRKRGIARITGLDPAEPYFQNTPVAVRLDLSDATLVDVIHTDAGPLVPNLGFGMSQVIGHLDFFPNGGIKMPGCQQNIEIPNVSVEDIWSGVVHFVTCNHNRATQYYTDSIGQSTIFTSYPCRDYSTYQAGSCRTCPSAGCPKMGHYADQYRGVTSASQVFYLNTS